MGLSDPPMTMLYDAEDEDEGDPVGFDPVLATSWFVSTPLAAPTPPVVSGYGYDPVLSAWSIGSSSQPTPPPTPSGYGYDPVLSAWWVTAPEGSTPPPTPSAFGFDPVLASWWVNGEYAYVPPVVYPLNLLAAIRAYVLTLPVTAQLTGGFRTNLAKRGGVTPYAVIRIESTSLEATSEDRDRMRVNVRLSVYDPDLDKATELGETLADEIEKASYRWKRGLSGYPQDRGRVPSIEKVRSPGGAIDLACLTARMEFHTTRDKF